MFSDSQNCAWMREGARSLIYPRCVTNASQFYIPQDQELPVPSEQCPEPQAGTFVTELTTQIRSSQWQALMNRLLWNQRAAWPTSHLSSKISAFLLLYGLLGKTKKKHTQTLKEIYLLYCKQISLCAKIDAVIDMQEKSQPLNRSPEQGVRILHLFQDRGPPDQKDFSGALILHT